MIHFLWHAAKGYRLRPWKSPYLRWRIETYWGLHADEIGFREFWRFVWTRRHDLRRFLKWAAANSIVLLATIACLAGQSPKAIIEQLERTVRYRDIAISLDGDHLAWVQSSDDNIVYTRLWRKPGAVPVRSGTSRDESDPAWSPASKSRILFGRQSQGSATVVRRAERRQLPRSKTQLKGHAERLRWSPDGKHIAFLYTESGAAADR